MAKRGANFDTYGDNQFKLNTKQTHNPKLPTPVTIFGHLS